MKKAIFGLCLLALLGCSKTDDSVKIDTIKIQDVGLVNEYNSFTDYFNENTLKSKTSDDSNQIYSLYDLYCDLETMQDDSLQQELFISSLDKYKNYFTLSSSGDLSLIIQDDKLAKLLNVNGLIKVGAEYFLFGKTEIKVYTNQNNNLVLSRVEPRKSTQTLKSLSTDNVVSKNGNWYFEFGPYNISKARRVTIYKTVEFNSNFGVYVGGRIYYKKKNMFGWSSCNTDLKMEYLATSFNYTDNNARNISLPIAAQNSCSNNHQISCGYTFTDRSSTNLSWSLVNPIVRFWRNGEGDETCYEFKQIN